MSRFRYVKHFSVLVAMSLFMIFNLQTSNAVTRHTIHDGVAWNNTVGWDQFGPSNNWIIVPNAGYLGTDFRYTFNTLNTTVNYARWVSVGYGPCEFWANIPGLGAGFNATRRAKYWLNSGSDWWAQQLYDQEMLSNQWFNATQGLSSSYICSFPSLYLLDVTGEPSGTKRVVYDTGGSYFP